LTNKANESELTYQAPTTKQEEAALLGDKLPPSCIPGEEAKFVALGSDEQGLLALPLPATKQQFACQTSFHWLDCSTVRINKDLLHFAEL
jgi:hypothetical protein